MLWSAAAFVTALMLPVPDSTVSTAHVDVRLDARRHQVVVTVGPFRVPVAMPMEGMDDMMMMHHAESLVGAFEWPQAALFHGVRLAVIDGRGQALPRRLLHHAYMLNFDRRQLVYSIMERPFSFGQETEDITTPATIGMPMGTGQRMGVVLMWDNQTGREVDGAYVRFTFLLNPANQRPAPMPVMPFFVDSHMIMGGRAGYDVPPGGRTIASDFTVPISGRLIAAGGHLHDHAVRMDLVEANTGRILLTVTARRDSAGTLSSVSRELPGLWGRGPHLLAGRPYRLVVVYDNPTSDTLSGSMGMMGGLFVPDDPGAWPKVDLTNPDWRADQAGIAGVTQLLALRR